MPSGKQCNTIACEKFESALMFTRFQCKMFSIKKCSLVHYFRQISVKAPFIDVWWLLTDPDFSRVEDRDGQTSKNQGSPAGKHSWAMIGLIARECVCVGLSLCVCMCLQESRSAFILSSMYAVSQMDICPSGWVIISKVYVGERMKKEARCDSFYQLGRNWFFFSLSFTKTTTDRFFLFPNLFGFLLRNVAFQIM